MNEQAALFVQTSRKDEMDPSALPLEEDGAAIYANDEGLRIARTWRVQGSATLDGRKALREFAEYAKATPTVKVLLFAQPERIGWGFKNVLSIYELIEKFEKEIHFFQNGLKLQRISESEVQLGLELERILAHRKAEELRPGRGK